MTVAALVGVALVTFLVSALVSAVVQVLSVVLLVGSAVVGGIWLLTRALTIVRRGGRFGPPGPVRADGRVVLGVAIGLALGLHLAVVVFVAGLVFLAAKALDLGVRQPAANRRR